MQKSIEKLKQYTKQPSTHYEENSGKGQQILEQGTQANYGFNYTLRHRGQSGTDGNILVTQVNIVQIMRHGRK